MTRPKGSKRRRQNPLWSQAAFAGAVDAALAEYMRLLGYGRPAQNPIGFLELLARLGITLPPEVEQRPGPEAALLGRVSPETLKRIHRLVVHDLHPDQGGDAEAMKAANAAWAEIKASRGMG